MNKRIPKPSSTLVELLRWRDQAGAEPGVSVGQSSTLVELLRWRVLHQPERQAYTFLTDEEQKEVHSVMHRR